MTWSITMKLMITVLYTRGGLCWMLYMLYWPWCSTLRPFHPTQLVEGSGPQTMACGPASLRSFLWRPMSLQYFLHFYRIEKRIYCRDCKWLAKLKIIIILPFTEKCQYVVIPLCLLVEGLELGVRYIKHQIVISTNPLFWNVSVSKTIKFPAFVYLPFRF